MLVATDCGSVFGINKASGRYLIVHSCMLKLCSRLLLAVPLAWITLKRTMTQRACMVGTASRQPAEASKAGLRNLRAG